jgi:hypothetical protein
MLDIEKIERKARSNGERDAFPDLDGGGLNKREWFAGMALQGILANSVEVVKSPFAEMYALQAADEILKQLAESDGAK